MPTDSVLLRHGMSEINAAARRARDGDHSLYTEEFLAQHVARARLTPLGRTQATQAGLFLRKEFPEGFSRYDASDNVRAFETAARLNLPDALWDRRIELGERDWGDLDWLSPDERQTKFAESFARHERDPLWWRPPNGERFSEVCTRVARYQAEIGVATNDDRPTLGVSHFEVMKAYEFNVSGASPEEFGEQFRAKGPGYRIENCEIFHFSRRNPYTGKISEKMEWLRRIRPTEDPVDISEWMPVGRRFYSNEELLQIAEGYPQLLSGE